MINWTRAARVALGLSPNQKLPTRGLSNGVFRLRPQGEQEGRWRRMKHRLEVQCTECGSYIPTGRMNQHIQRRDHADRHN